MDNLHERIKLVRVANDVHLCRKRLNIIGISFNRVYINIDMDMDMDIDVGRHHPWSV